MSILICLFYFFLFTVQFSKVIGVQALWKYCVYLPLSLSDPPCFGHDVHWCVSVRLSLPSSPSVHVQCPSLSQTCAPLCLRLTLSHSSFLSLFHIASKSVIYHVAKFVFHPLPQHFCYGLSLYCTEAVPTQQFNMQHSNATPGPSTPSSGCLPQFSFNEEVKASFAHFFFFNFQIQM